MKIKTYYERPPIPRRDFDWAALDVDTYDGAEGSNGPIGWGETEEKAVDDLLERFKSTWERERDETERKTA